MGFLAYSPLGRGFLTGEIRRYEDFAADDFRRHLPRFSGENFAKNLVLVDRVREMAAAKGCTPSQLALAWLLARAEVIVPIPGTKRVRYLEDNLGAAAITLGAAELAQLEAAFPREAAVGERYVPSSMKFVNS